MDSVVVSGLFVGLIYGLLGIGLVVVYRGSRVVNFAHGETGMVAAFLFADLRFGSSSLTAATTDNGLLFTVPIVVLGAAAVGALTELFVARPLRNAPRIRALVGTFAVAAMLRTYAVRQWGTEVRFAKPLVEGDGITIGSFHVQRQQLLILAVTTVILVGLWALYRLTPFGLRLRAVALDPYAATLVGVNVNRTSMATWALAGAIAGLSAILIAPLVAFNVFFMAALAIRGLAAALVGGLTSLSGAFVAGVALGVAEAVIAYTSPISGLTDVALATFVLALMLVRPSGLVRSAY